MNNDNALYWVWLSLALGFHHHLAGRIYALYNDISVFYLGKEFEWRLSGLFTNAELKKLLNTKLSDAEQILSDCEKYGIQIISIESDLYPNCLREIYAPPAVLYVKGSLPDMQNVFSVAMVGTRRATRYGVKNAFDLSYNLSRYGAVIVSGGAMGIDSAAHNGALRSGGVTVCVLGCGINYDYLRQNRKMREAITVKGALVSEYPPDTAPLPYHFPARNRLISALSNAVLVVEAGASSGSLITANCAAEQGKDVFAVMGNIDSPMSCGSNTLIKEGAVPVSNFRDVLNHYPNLYTVSAENGALSGNEGDIAAVPVKVPAQKKKNQGEANCRQEPLPEQVCARRHIENTGLEPFAESVYLTIGAEAIHIDDLAASLCVPMFKLLPVITELELQGLIESVGGRYYKLAARS